MDLDFAPPGPGMWALDRSHYPGGATPITQWLMSESMSAGMSTVFAEIGVPAQCVEAAFVHGFMYTRLRPLIGADKPPKRLPPLPVLRLVTRIHPAFRQRAKRASITLRDRPSLDVAARWVTEIRPRLHAENMVFQRIEPRQLDDVALSEHVAALLDHTRRQLELHFWLHGHDIGPIARYLHACIGWGLDPTQAIDALAGASPSTTRPVHTLVRLRRLVDASDREITSLADVRSVSAAAASLLDDYLDEHGQVLATGYDLTASTLAELDGVVLASIGSAVPPPGSDHAAVSAALRQRLPIDAGTEFDQVLADARAVMDMRDDNGPLTAEWPIGLLRRALLAAGERLALSGRIADAEHVFELAPSEARSMFGGALPASDELAERAERRMRLATADPPAVLGQPEPAPPLEVLPPSLALTVAMVQVALQHLGMDGAAPADQLTGIGVGEHRYRGRARVAGSADEAIEKLEPGDVLIVRATSPAFNAVLAIAGAIVTAAGGAMSHAAVLARELGIPAVIGAGAALTIADGSLVEVDPVAGAVRVISEPSVGR